MPGEATLVRVICGMARFSRVMTGIFVAFLGGILLLGAYGPDG